MFLVVSPRTDPDDDVVDVTSLPALDVVEILLPCGLWSREEVTGGY